MGMVDRGRRRCEKVDGCGIVCERSACVREVFVVVAGAPARSRRLRVREVREVERGVGGLVEVDGGWWTEVWEGWSRWMVSDANAIQNSN